MIPDTSNLAKKIWSPQPQQRIFLERPEFEVFYGGAAGGGKSDSLLIEALRQVKNSKYRAIIFRKTFPQLSELIDRSRELYKTAFPSAKYNEQQHCWTFRSGAKIYFASMQHSKNKTNYQGKQFQFIGFDELTHFTWEEYSYMLSRCRARGEGQRCYVRSTGNPGGLGHGWVKERFIDLEAYKRYYDYIEIEGKKILRDRCFIPATLFDNKILMDNDPNYIANLAMLGEKDRNALLYGDWESYEGQYYPEFKKRIHVVTPFEIPNYWKRFCSLDYGLDMTACYWWAVDDNNVCYVYRELHESNLSLSQAAKKIVEMTTTNEKISYVVASPDLWNRRQETGASGMEIMLKSGLRGLIKANNTRVQGWRNLREFLGDEENSPNIFFFSNCLNIIKNIPLLQHDILFPEDVSGEPHEITHAPESIRYGIMSRPRPNRKIVTRVPQWKHEVKQSNQIDKSWINY